MTGQIAHAFMKHLADMTGRTDSWPATRLPWRPVSADHGPLKILRPIDHNGGHEKTRARSAGKAAKPQMAGDGP